MGFCAAVACSKPLHRLPLRSQLIDTKQLEFRRFEIDVPFYRHANATEQICKAWIAMKIAEFGQDRQKDKKRFAFPVGFLQPLERLLSITFQGTLGLRQFVTQRWVQSEQVRSPAV